MKILNETSDGLKRSCAILLSKEDLDAATKDKLREIAKKVRLDGFRPGKAPLDILKRMYGDSVASDAKKQAVTDACKKFLKDAKLTLSLSYVTEMVRDENDELEFLMKFELIPAFDLKDVSGVELVKHVAEVEDKEVEETLESIRKEIKKWSEDESGGAIENGQKILINLGVASFDKKIKNNGANDVEIIIGDEGILEDFWKPFVGAKVSDTVEFSVTYPENIAEKSLAGKTVSYKAVVKKVSNSSEHNLDDEFAKAIGREDFEKAREWAKSILAAKYERMSKEIVRRDLLDKVSLLYDFEVPQNMTELENRVIITQIEEEAKKLDQEFTQEIRDGCRKISEQRVRLGFVVAEIAKIEKISVSRDEVYRAIRNIASMYPGQEKEIWQRYARNDAVQAVIGPILEDKVVEFLYGKVKVSEEKCSVAELVAFDEETFDFFKENDEEEKKAEKPEHHKKHRKQESKEVEKQESSEKDEKIEPEASEGAGEGTPPPEKKKSKKSSHKIKEEEV
jgi:trigger factor